MNKASEILLGFINNRSALTLTHADVLVGIFPWNKPESITNTNPDIRAFILTSSILFSISTYLDFSSLLWYPVVVAEWSKTLLSQIQVDKLSLGSQVQIPLGVALMVKTLNKKKLGTGMLS